jgi:c-di-GMP-binding flagellar brake protein YcgR
MLTLEQDRSLFTYEIDPRRARRLLEVAVRRKARVSVTTRHTPEILLNGTIASGTPESLWIELEALPKRTVTGLQSMCCEVVLELDGTRYLFETNALALIEDAAERRLELARPETLHVLQRRRFCRASVHESSPVHLVRLAAAGVEPWSGSVSLLNVSPVGVACLARQDDADATYIGDVLQVTFELPTEDEPFVLEGTVRSKTPSRDAGQVLLGLEFHHGEDGEQFRRLQSALAPGD